MRLSRMSQHLVILSEPLEETKVVAKFLWSVPSRYRQIVLLIQTLLDISTLTLVNVTGRLKAAEQEMEAPLPMMNHNGKIYLTEEALWRSGSCTTLTRSPMVDQVTEVADAKADGATEVADARTAENVVRMSHHQPG
jgi:hypothetical protein